MAAKTQHTKQTLLLTAERLFAEHGWESVSLRRISAEAGQRNTSAMQYHYGGKPQLLEAILDYRMGAMDERRRCMLEEEADETVRNLLNIMVSPLLEELCKQPEESYYISLLSQLYSRHREDLLFPQDERRTGSVTEIRNRLRALLPAMSEAEWAFRQSLMGMALIHGVASVDDRRRQQGCCLSEEEVIELKRIMLDFLEGGLRNH